MFPFLQKITEDDKLLRTLKGGGQDTPAGLFSHPTLNVVTGRQRMETDVLEFSNEDFEKVFACVPS